MKKSHIVSLCVAVLILGIATGATFVHQGTQNQKLGFGSVITANSQGSVAISSCEAMCKVDADNAAQIGSGTNEDDNTIAYRGNKLPLVNVDTNVTTAPTAYTPVMVGEMLVGGYGTGTNAMWVSTGLTTNDWMEVVHVP
jgi:hypothetical protein